MTKIKYVEMSDKEFWFTLDRHLPELELPKKRIWKATFGTLGKRHEIPRL